MESSTSLDAHGQPDPIFNYKLRRDRAVNELLGIARGVICDGVFNDMEIDELRAWLRQNPDACVGFPGGALCDRLMRIFADGKIDDDERSELADFLEALTGERQVSDAAHRQKSSLAPVDHPPPIVRHEGAQFVITGRFLCGTRGFVTHRLQSRGALVEKDITKQTDYVLLGSMASRDWKHGRYGLKIAKALEYRDQGVAIAIIAEDHWTSQLAGAI